MLEWSEVPTDICREECLRTKPDCSYRSSRLVEVKVVVVVIEVVVVVIEVVAE